MRLLCETNLDESHHDFVLHKMLLEKNQPKV